MTRADISHQRNLLEKRKKGKTRRQAVAAVEIPQRAFMSVLDQDD